MKKTLRDALPVSSWEWKPIVWICKNCHVYTWATFLLRYFFTYFEYVNIGFGVQRLHIFIFERNNRSVSTERTTTHLKEWADKNLKIMYKCKPYQCFILYSKQWMHIYILWFAKVEKILKLLGQMGYEVVFWYMEHTVEVRGVVWSERWLESFIQFTALNILLFFSVFRA